VTIRWFVESKWKVKRKQKYFYQAKQIFLEKNGEKCVGLLFETINGLQKRKVLLSAKNKKNYQAKKSPPTSPRQAPDTIKFFLKK